MTAANVPDLTPAQFGELLAAFVSVRAEIGNPRRAAHVVIDRRFNVPAYGWPLVVDAHAATIFRRDLVIALLACSDVVAVGWETPATRTDEPHPTTTRRGPDGPGDDIAAIEGLGGGPTMGAKRRQEREQLASACPHGVPFPTSCRACGYGGPDAVDP